VRTRALALALALTLASVLVLPGCASPGVALTAEMETAINAARSAQSLRSAEPSAPGPAADTDTGAAGTSLISRQQTLAVPVRGACRSR
jgi:hypothetical protein